AAQRERETYVGTWLPEPVVESGEDEADDVTLPLLMALDRLSPLERAAFFAASRDGEMERLRALLAADVTVYADGGGKATTHGAPVAGLDNVMRLFATFASVFAVSRS